MDVNGLSLDHGRLFSYMFMNYFCYFVFVVFLEVSICKFASKIAMVEVQKNNAIFTVLEARSGQWSKCCRNLGHVLSATGAMFSGLDPLGDQ